MPWISVSVGITVGFSFSGANLQVSQTDFSLLLKYTTEPQFVHPISSVLFAGLRPTYIYDEANQLRTDKAMFD